MVDYMLLLRIDDKGRATWKIVDDSYDLHTASKEHVAQSLAVATKEEALPPACHGRHTHAAQVGLGTN